MSSSSLTAFYWKNHKGAREPASYCGKNCNPKKCAALSDKMNTEAAEQAFAWLARSKHVFRHMNEARFMYVMLRLMTLRNRHLAGEPLW